MPPIAQVARRPAVVAWGMALLAIAIMLAVLGVSAITYQALIGAAVIAGLLGLGDIAAVELEDQSTLSPAPALLIAGLAVAGWPLLLVAVVLGTLVTALLPRRPLGRALLDAGARCVVVAMMAPIYHFTQPPALPYTTPLGLFGLLLIGAFAYATELVFGAGGAEQGALRVRWRARLGAMRWYVLAMIPLGGLLGALWSVGPLAFLIGLAPLAVAQRMFLGEITLRRTTAEFASVAVQREKLATRLERLLALATTMIGTLDVQKMLEILCERLAALLDAPYGWVVLLDDGGRPRLMTGHNLPELDDDQDPFASSESYLPIFERGLVVLVTDERCQALAPLGAQANAEHWSAVLSIPLVGEKQVHGAICLAFDRLRGLEADEQRVLTSFARQAALALENARLFNELRRKQSELIQSSKLAAVGTFAAGIAHEFNNLLGGMLGYAELGYRSEEVEEKNHSLDIVMQSCRRGRSITRGLLTFARRQEHHRALSDVTDAIDETLTLIELDLRKANIEVVRRIDLVPPTVCDLGQISQVVLNLLTNARDAMRPDGGTLTVTLRERRGQLELSVADTGCGIPEEIRDKVFEPFVTTKGALGGSQTPGTGLGLSVSYGIVQEHGGTIEVESVPGRGTTMIVRLPIIAATEIEQAIAVGQH